MSTYGRAAQRAARQLFSAVKGASEMGSMRGAAMASSGSAASSARAAPCMSSNTASVLSSWRSQCQLAGLKPAVSMPFAASAPAASAMPPMNKASCVQVRASSSGDATDEGDGADEGTTSNSTSPKAPPDGGDDDDENRTRSQSLLDDIDDDEDEEGLGAAGPGDAALDSVLERLYGLGAASKDVDRKTGVNMEMYARQDNEDPLGLLVIAKESFMGKDQNALPIPPAVREAMYQHRWDKLLVDVRRTVDLTRRGKREQYTSMVAVGNLNGLFGLGIGTADTAQLSVARAYLDSYTNLTYVPLYRGHTVFHTIDHEFHRLKMRIMPRPAGFGLVCGPLVYELCNLIGLRNATIKVLGRRKNKFFVAKALQEALQKQSTPYDGVEATGMYIREVYHRRKLPAGLVRGVDVM